MEKSTTTSSGKEEHGDDCVERAPLDAEVFDEMGPEGAGHSGPSEFVGFPSHVPKGEDLGTRRCVFDDVGGLDFDFQGLCGAEIVVWARG